MEKIKWRGVFNYERQVYTLYGHAYTEKQAWLTFCRRLSDKHDVSIGIVTGLFDGSKSNFRITKEE
jgi:hypothetical protein